MEAVATQRKREPDPIGEEGRRILAENPGLYARLREYQRKRKAGEPLKVVEHAELRRRLKDLGVPLDED
jgi:hypothetical protein